MVKSEILVRNPSPRLFVKKFRNSKKVKTNHAKTRLRDFNIKNASEISRSCQNFPRPTFFEVPFATSILIMRNLREHSVTADGSYSEYCMLSLFMLIFSCLIAAFSCNVRAVCLILESFWCRKEKRSLCK